MRLVAHGDFIMAAYGVAVFILAALIVWIVFDYRALRRTLVIDAGMGTSWTLAPEDIPETGAPDRTAEIDLAVRSRRLVGGSWVTDREARRFRLTAPFAAGWDRGWGFLWGT